ncbi:MAG TPA: hypothetical protein VMJ75_03135 [Candidatus Acidoferrales bacterium]|nr:hypothetical protein [Candidatus Acidoferrales bacterium]
MLLNRTRSRLPWLLFAAIVCFHFAAAWMGGPAANWHGATSEYYPLLTDGFRSGHTSLPVTPRAELLALPNPYDPIDSAPYRLHDASLYRGKYYLYFGPTPVLTLFLPYRLLTGRHLPSRAAVALFSAAGFACSCALFFLVARRERWDCPPWLASAAVLSLGTSCGVLFLVVRPSFYEVAISAGYCFLAAGFFLAARALGSDSPRLALLTAAGLCFGLAAGCRPNFVLVAILIAALVCFHLRSHRMSAAAFVAPVILCGLVLAWYNYARFGSPFEFGARYELTNGYQNQRTMFTFGLANIVPGFYYLVFTPPWIGSHYPFLGLNDATGVFATLPDGFSVGPNIGLLWAAPVALLAFMAPLIWSRGRVSSFCALPSSRFIIGALCAVGFGMTALFVLLGWSNGRYNVDFMPGLLILAWLLLGALWQAARTTPGKEALWFRNAVVGLTLYSASVDYWMCLQHGSR